MDHDTAAPAVARQQFASDNCAGMCPEPLQGLQEANAMAQSLYQGLLAIPQVKTLHAPQANSVFAQLPEAAVQALHAQGWKFYQFIAGGGCRFVCAWDTTPASVSALLSDMRAGVASAAH